MPYFVYYRGEVTISPPLTEEHAVVVLAFSRKEYNDLTKPIFANIAATLVEDLPAHMDVFDISEDRTTILPDEDESTHGLRLCLILLVEHFFAPLGYLLNGGVSWDADDVNDRGTIFVKDNLIEDVEDENVNAGPSWSPDHYSDPCLKQAIQDLVDSADNAGCSDDLTVVSAKSVEYLREALPKL
ncbi:MAG TPA: hypothetical protein VHX20_11385 [Terracidiphilus sp.]|jgi:hypothetical protein|nr:hypothetical protein [Terracidiphilus sp.]